jgi:hypothetical protein
LWIADVGNVLFAPDNKMVDFRLEGLTHLSSGAGEIDEHAAGINHIHAETVKPKPRSDGIKIGFRYSEPFAELLRGEPVMEIGRAGSVEFIEKLLKGFLLLRGALQLQEHVLHCEITCHGAAVVRKDSFGTRVAMEHDAIRFIEALRDARTTVRAGFYLCEVRRRSGESSEDNYGEEP